MDNVTTTIAIDTVNVVAYLARGTAQDAKEIAEMVVSAFEQEGKTKFESYALAMRLLAAVRNGVYVALAHLMMKASLELNKPMIDLVDAVFDPEDRSFRASASIVSQMKSLAQVIIPAMHQKGMTHDEILDALIMRGGVQKAYAITPAVRATMRSDLPDEEKKQLVDKALSLIDPERTVEEVKAEAQKIKRKAEGKQPDGYYTEIEMPGDGDKVMVVAIVPRDKVGPVKTALGKIADQTAWSPSDIIGMLSAMFRKTGGK